MIPMNLSNFQASGESKVNKAITLLLLTIFSSLVIFYSSLRADERKTKALGGEINIKGNVGGEFKWYIKKPPLKLDYNLAGLGEIESVYLKGPWFGKLLIEGLIDTQEEERDYFRANEAYLQYDFVEQDLRVTAGREVLFWGALEVYNPVNIINRQVLTRDPFEVFKKGSYLISCSKYLESSEIQLLTTLYEQDQEFPGKESPYYIFPEFLTYDKNLITEESRKRPTGYLKYSGSTDTFYPLDYALVVSNGYDSQRLITPVGDGILRQNAYIASKFLTFDTLVVNATLLKLEASYTDVKDVPNISDYYQVGAGIEHTLEQVYRGWDMGLISEYYLYKTTDKNKSDDLRLFQSFQNDLFLGFRLTFNDVASSEIVGGGIFDLEYDGEYSLFAEFNTRVFDMFTLSADIRKIVPNTEGIPTVYELIGDHLRITLNVKYHF
jgi:hypothetical protein